MMNVQQNISLYGLNTFGLAEQAEYFAELTSTAQIASIPAGITPVRILGGGSNILLTAPVKGLVIRNMLKGIQVIKENADYVWLEVQSGEVWHELVMYATRHNWGGIENLALIPGTAGAAPIQNIGAYGAEAKDTIETVNFWNFATNQLEALPNAACRFGYRDSIFKQELAGKTLITSVVFRLTKQPALNTSYGAIEQELAAMNLPATVQNIAAAVMSIRQSKLPDPSVTGNAGSFFKNPVISVQQYEGIRDQYPAPPSWPAACGQVKIPAAWLIEQCGWKGYREHDYGVHNRQALVLVNYGNAAGSQIWDLSGRIVQSVQEKFNITLEREVQVW
jgi:UDP-N-acetylmuramate dehydrogenase